MKLLLAVFPLTVLLGAIFLFYGYGENAGTVVRNNTMAAAVFFTQSTSVPILRETFNNASSTKKKLNILIVPGHEPNFGGAEYRNIKERDLNADLGFELAQYLVEDGHYRVVIARGRDGWNPDIQNYFTTHADEIKKFVEAQKTEMLQLVQKGKITTRNNNTPHNDAPDDVAMRLFGINKWANENNMDIIIHIHFNDTFPRDEGAPGEYNGFTIYTPDHQYSNAQATAEVAKNVFTRLSKMFPISNLPQENQGVVEDQDLIAVGNSNTIDAASMLIEYGYIYESQLQVSEVRKVILKELALQTYLGISDFFGEASQIAGGYESTLLPYDGRASIEKTQVSNRGVLAFQAALSDKGFYPPENYTRNECPISGFFGPCTKTALSEFQNKFEIKGEHGVVGAKTRAHLRALFHPNFVGAL